MPKALRLTDRTKFKIAQQVDMPIDDIQALMEYYSHNDSDTFTYQTLRPYCVLEPYIRPPVVDNNWMIMTDQHFHATYTFTTEEDPCMFTDVILK